MSDTEQYRETSMPAKNLPPLGACAATPFPLWPGALYPLPAPSPLCGRGRQVSLQPQKPCWRPPAPSNSVRLSHPIATSARPSWRNWVCGRPGTSGATRPPPSSISPLPSPTLPRILAATRPHTAELLWHSASHGSEHRCQVPRPSAARVESLASALRPNLKQLP